jgi:hypothetical protein
VSALGGEEYVVGQIAIETADSVVPPTPAPMSDARAAMILILALLFVGAVALRQTNRKAGTDRPPK